MAAKECKNRKKKGFAGRDIEAENAVGRKSRCADDVANCFEWAAPDLSRSVRMVSPHGILALQTCVHEDFRLLPYARNGSNPAYRSKRDSDVLDAQRISPHRPLPPCEPFM